MKFAQGGMEMKALTALIDWGILLATLSFIVAIVGAVLLQAKVFYIIAFAAVAALVVLVLAISYRQRRIGSKSMRETIVFSAVAFGLISVLTVLLISMAKVQ